MSFWGPSTNDSNSDAVPDVDITRNLGSAVLRWLKIFVKQFQLGTPTLNSAATIRAQGADAILISLEANNANGLYITASTGPSNTGTIHLVNTSQFSGLSDTNLTHFALICNDFSIADLGLSRLVKFDASNRTVRIDGHLSKTAPPIKTVNFTWAATENSVIVAGAASVTATLPSASTFPGRELLLKTTAAFTVVSASSNVIPLNGGAAGTAILAATVGKWALLISDGTNWNIMAAN
jgi:hypothetical protein